MILYATMKKGIKGAWEMDRGITEILRDKGFKVTPQRLAIYKILKANTLIFAFIVLTQRFVIVPYCVSIYAEIVQIL